MKNQSEQTYDMHERFVYICHFSNKCFELDFILNN